jgi:hypothetical protein
MPRARPALAAKANDEAARVKQAAERILGELQKSLQRERDQRERLERNSASAEHANDAPVPPEAGLQGSYGDPLRSPCTVLA